MRECEDISHVKKNMICSEVAIASLFGLLQSFSFSLFYHGTSRISKSLNNIFYIALLNFILGSLLWFAVGYSLVFGKSQKGFIGAMDHALLLGIHDAQRYGTGNETVCATPYVTMVILDMTFAILAPAMVLITWSEYIKPSGAMLIMILWPLLVYYPIAHWTRGDGWLSDTLIDSAGGLTSYTTVGTSHFLLTILTKRKFPNCDKLSLVDQYLQMKTGSRNSVLIFLGSLLTMAGWFSLNVGSVRNVGLVLLNTHLSACGSATFWMMVCVLYTRESSYVDLLYGLMAGLAGLPHVFTTSGSSSFCGHVEPWSSVLIGCFIGSLSHGIFILSKNHTTSCIRENCVDITVVFGIPGIIGSIAAGLFSNTRNGQEIVEVHGAFYSNPLQLPYQFLGIVVVILWSSLWTLLLFKFIESTVGLFISENQERQHSELDACEIHIHNNKERLVKESLMKAAKNGDLQKLQDLKRKFVVNFGMKDFYQKTALHYTSENGDYVCTQYLLKQPEVNVHTKDRYGVTALSEAVRKHRYDIIILLLEHGASWSADGVGEILCSYVASGKIDQVRKLHDVGMDLNSTDSQGRTALHIAACHGDRLMVECLLSLNAQLNKVDCFGHRPLNCAEMHEHEAISEILIRHGGLRIIQNYSQQEICHEASKGNLRMITHMVDNGANVSYRDSIGKTALHASCKSGHLDVVRFLLNQPGVDVNVRDKKNNTPLLEAIVNRQNDVAEYLQLHGGETDERRVMHLICKAVKNHDKLLAKQLLQWFNGSKVTDLDGQSVYHVCVRNGDVEMLKTLVKAGISLKEVDFFGNTPLELAIQLRCDSSVIKFLAEVEEGRIKPHSSQVNLEQREPPTKSKIRRRRTRRQTRVEVASGDFSDTSLPGLSKEGNNVIKNCMVNEVENDVEDGSLGTTTPEEVTLADIELMNRRKKINPSRTRMSEIFTGEPQYV